MKHPVGWALLGIYMIACVLSLLVICIGAYGSFDAKPDPLFGLLALVLALPWSLVLGFFSALTPLLSVIVMAVGMGLNIALMLAVLRGRTRRSPQNSSP